MDDAFDRLCPENSIQEIPFPDIPFVKMNVLRHGRLKSVLKLSTTAKPVSQAVQQMHGMRADISRAACDQNRHASTSIYILPLCAIFACKGIKFSHLIIPCRTSLHNGLCAPALFFQPPRD